MGPRLRHPLVPYLRQLARLALEGGYGALDREGLDGKRPALGFPEHVGATTPACARRARASEGAPPRPLRTGRYLELPAGANPAGGGASRYCTTSEPLTTNGSPFGCWPQGTVPPTWHISER